MSMCCVCKQVGYFDDLILVQASTVSLFYKVQNVWPNINIQAEDFQISEGLCEALQTPEWWIVHGLWPHRNHGQSPRSCDSNSFDLTTINDDLKRRLEVEWPSFTSNQSPDALWSFEWDTHGSCTTNIESLDSIPKYFNKTLELAYDHNIGTILGLQSIVPGGSYQLDDIYNTLRNSLLSAIVVKCWIDPATGEQFLLEVLICFNKNTLVIDDCEPFGLIGCDTDLLATYGDVERYY